MLSSRIIGGSTAAGEPVAAGDSLQWVLVNDGTVTWPAGTTLRLVGGPAKVCPIIEVPPAAPGQTVDINLEVQPMDEPAQVFYSLVTPDCQPFGEIAQAKIAPKAAPPPPPAPALVVLTTPMDGTVGGVEAMQGEVKTVEWMLANVGHVPWPKDTKAVLIYNTPGFEHLPCEINLPAVRPGMTVHAGVTVLMPERQGLWKAMWAVTSPTHPEFGDVLLAEFKVSDFPFMDWMLADAATADCISEVSSLDAPEPAAKKPPAVGIALQNHLFPGRGEVEYPEGAEDTTLKSLGFVSGMVPGEPWLLQLALTNEGEESWPADAALTLCFGSGFGCDCVSLDGYPVSPGETVVLQVELTAPERAGKSAWVMTSGRACFGPAMMLDVAV